MTLSAGSGTLTLSGTGGLTFWTGDGTADVSMTFAGPLAAVNAALAAVTYAAPAGFTGSDAVSLAVDDLGNTGGGGSRFAFEAVPINVAASAPTVWIERDRDATEGAASGGRFAVHRSTTTGPLTVNYAAPTGTAKPDDPERDYSGIAALGGTVTFGDGQSVAYLDVNPVNDTRPEPTETVTVSLAPASGGEYAIGNPSGGSGGSATLSIFDNDPARVWIEWYQDATEGSPVPGQFAVRRNASGGALVVNYGPPSGTATGGGVDYTGPNASGGSVTIPDGETVAYLDVYAVADTLSEGTETVVVGLASYTGSGPGYTVSGGAATVDIADANPAEVSVTATGPAVEGGANGSVTFARTGDTTAALTVNFTATGTATPPGTDADYALADVTLSAGVGSVVIPAGKASVTVALTAENDAWNEGPEDAVFAVASGSGYVPTGSAATVTIRDNDPATPSVFLDPSSLVVGEGGTATVTVKRTGGSASSSLSATVNVGAVPGNANKATFTTDYTITDAKGTTYTLTNNAFTVTFESGSTEFPLTITAKTDGVTEPDETFRLSVASGGSSYTTGSPATADVTIQDKTVTVSVASDITVTEGEFGTVTVSRVGDTSAPVSVSLQLVTESGVPRAAWDADFSLATPTGTIAPSGSAFTVVIPAGQSSVTLTVTAKRDGRVEGDEAVRIRAVGGAAGSANGYAVSGGGSRVTIADDPPVVAVTASTNAAEEGKVPGTFTLTRTGGDPDLPLTAYFTLGGTATKGASATDPLGDYAVSGATYLATQKQYRVVFPGRAGAVPGQGTVTVQIVPIDDDVYDPDETVSLTLGTSPAAYTLGAPAAQVLTILDNEPALAPLGLARGGNVRPRDGAVGVDATDLTSSGFGAPWGQRRVWTNDPMQAGYAGNQWGGNGWVLLDLPSVVKSGDSVFQVQVGTDFLTFDKAAGSETYTPRFFTLDTLTHDTTLRQFVLTRTDGTRVEFFDFNENWPEAARGQFSRQVEPDGFVTGVNGRTNGLPNEVIRSATVAGQGTVEERYEYAWTGNRIASVTLSRKVNGGSSQVVRSVEYAYYADGEANGNAGDLKTAVVQDANGAIVDRSYYRYYTADGAGQYKGGLKMSFGPAAFERLLYATGDPFGVSDTVAAAYADLAFTYDATKRVVSRTVAGAGSSDAGGRGTFTYAYAKSSTANDVNAWKVRTTVTRPDLTKETVYSNAYAEPMLSAVRPAGTSQQWVTYTRYDSAGRAILTANPSAVTGYSESAADLVNVVGGNAQYLLDSGGLITVTSYYGSTGGGGVAGYYAGTSLRKGEFGTLVPQTATTYATHTDAGITVHPVASTTVYRNDNGTGARTTTFDYEWFPGTVQAKVIDTTPPVISAAENGSGIAVWSSTVFDSFGRAEWSRDAAGVVTHTSRDLATGAVTGVIEDVSDSNPVMPAAFATYAAFLDFVAPGALASTGKNRETVYEVDSLGRTTRVEDANHHVTYTTYNDPAHEIRTYRGWNVLTSTPTGPVEVMREDRGRGYVETYTSSALPDVVGGRPTGTELPVLESLSRTAVNAAGQTISTDAYFNLDGLAYSPGMMGAAGSNFYRTTYGYDVAGRSSRVTSPGLTTDTTVFDGLGRPVSTWTESTAAAMAKTQVSTFQYDNGGVGDSNRTATSLYPGGGAAARVTRAWFDWRNRPVAEKQGAQSSENAAVNRPLTYMVFNNLGESVLTDVYDGDGVTPVDANADGTPDAPAAALLRGRSVTSFNEWGQAYQTTDYGANPLTGALAYVPLVTNIWFDLRGLAAKTQLPGGRVEKAQFDGLGQLTSWFNASDGGSSSWSDALTVANDRVLTQVDYEYDNVGNSTRTTTRTQFDGVSIVGNLNGQSGVRVTTTGAFYDAADRLTDTVDVGTNGLLSLSQAPPRSDTAHVTSYQYDSGGRVQIVTDPLDRVFLTEYDSLGRPVSETLAANSKTDAWTTFYGYDYSGRLESVTQPGGRTTTYGYDGFERQNSVTLPMGRTFTTAFNSLGETISSTDAEGSVTQTLYDTLGRAISVTAGFGSSAAGTVKAAYDVFGRVIKATDERGKVTSTLFNDADRTTTVTDAVGKVWTSYTDLAGNLTKSVDPLGKAWESVFDIWNRFTSSKDPLGNTTQQKYLVNGDKYVTIDARNNAITNVIDDFDRSAKALDAALKGSTSTYDRANRTKTVTDATGAVTEYQYDNLDRVRVLTEAKGAPEQRETVYDYDTKGDLFSVITPNGFETFSVFDDAGRVVERTVANGTAESLVTEFEYDRMNRVTLLTAPGDRQTMTNYDERGRVTDVTTGYGTPLARTTFNIYDAAGNQTYLVEPLGRITEFVYDNLDRVIRVVDPVGGVTRTTYDDAGRRKTLTDPVGNVTTWGYDDAGRMTRETDRFGETRYTDYDKVGNIIAITDRNGAVRSYGYDSRDRKVSETWYQGPAILQVQGYGYDDNGNLTSATDPDGSYTFTHDKLNRVKTVDGPFGVAWTFDYDSNGNRTSAADNKGGVTVTGYDGLDRPVARTVSVAGADVATLGWTYEGTTGDLAATTRTAAGGATLTETFAYDTLGRQTGITYTSPSGSTSFTTTYDAADRVTSETRDGVTKTFGYDDRDQLTSDNGVSHSYDKNGNRTDAGYVRTAGNRLRSDGTWTYRYNDEGQQVSKSRTGEAWTYTYDLRGQMTSATKADGSGVRYGYDAFGNRVRTETLAAGGAVTGVEQYAVDGWDTAKPGAIGTENFDVAMDLNASGAVTGRRMFGPGFDDVLGKAAGGAVTWYVTDRQQSVRGTVDAAGGFGAAVNYDAFGNVVAGVLTDRYGYTGREFEAAVDLYHYRWRMLNARTGLFTSQDSLDREINPYRYAGNSPTNRVDPSGMEGTPVGGDHLPANPPPLDPFAGFGNMAGLARNAAMQKNFGNGQSGPPLMPSVTGQSGRGGAPTINPQSPRLGAYGFLPYPLVTAPPTVHSLDQMQPNETFTTVYRFAAGLAQGYVESVSPIPITPHWSLLPSSAYGYGRLAGNFVGIVSGLAEIGAGAGMMAGGGGVSVGSGGTLAVVGVPTVVIGGVVTAHGGFTVANGTIHFVQNFNSLPSTPPKTPPSPAPANPAAPAAGKPPEWATLEPNLTRTSKESVGNLERSLKNNKVPQPTPDHIGHHVIPGSVYDDLPMLKEIGFRIDHYPNGAWVHPDFHPGRHPAYTSAMRKILGEIPMPTDAASRAAAAQQVGKVLDAAKSVLSGQKPPLRFQDAKALTPKMHHAEFTAQWEAAIRAAMK